MSWLIRCAGKVKLSLFKFLDLAFILIFKH